MTDTHLDTDLNTGRHPLGDPSYVDACRDSALTTFFGRTA